MASSKEYLNYVMEQLSDVGDVTCKPMMGEYILYCRGVIVGGVYDDRLLIKPTKAAKELLPDAPTALPYPGAKEMLLVEELDDREFLTDLLRAMTENNTP